MLLRRFHYICSLLLTYYSTKYSDRICNLSLRNEINGGWINRYSLVQMLLCTSVSDHRIALQLAFHLIETNNSTIKRGAEKKKKERKETRNECIFNFTKKHVHSGSPLGNILIFHTGSGSTLFLPYVLALAIHLNGENKFDERSATRLAPAHACEATRCTYPCNRTINIFSIPFESRSARVIGK